MSQMAYEIAAALAHDGPVLVDVVVSRSELAMPPAVTVEMAEAPGCQHSALRAAGWV